MPPTRLAPAAALALVASVTLSSCSGGDQRARRPSEPSTPLASFDSTSLTLPREAFCDRVTAASVKRALGAAPQQASVYEPGEKAPLTPSVSDVADEFSCTFQAGEATARAWLFAPPVSPGDARTMVVDLRRTTGCASDTEAPAFGDPSLALVCRSGGRAEASYRGLFGDAWLSCSVSVATADADPKDLVDRAGRWCVAVAVAARG